MMLSFCTKNLDSEFTQFVDGVEMKYEQYDQADWAKADMRYNQLLTKTEKAGSGLSEEQKAVINQQMGRYQALKFKYEATGLMKGIGDVIKQFDGFINEIAGDTSHEE